MLGFRSGTNDLAAGGVHGIAGSSRRRRSSNLLIEIDAQGLHAKSRATSGAILQEWMPCVADSPVPVCSFDKASPSIQFLETASVAMATKFIPTTGCGGFLDFMLEYARPLAYEGRWQSRYVARSSHTQQPIALDVHSDGLQAIIRRWHGQHYKHAQAPLILFFQVKRWTQKRHRVTKDHSVLPVEVGEHVDLPCFQRVRRPQLNGLDIVLSASMRTLVPTFGQATIGLS